MKESFELKKAPTLEEQVAAVVDAAIYEWVDRWEGNAKHINDFIVRRLVVFIEEQTAAAFEAGEQHEAIRSAVARGIYG